MSTIKGSLTKPLFELVQNRVTTLDQLISDLTVSRSRLILRQNVYQDITRELIVKMSEIETENIDLQALVIGLRAELVDLQRTPNEKFQILEKTPTEGTHDLLDGFDPTPFHTPAGYHQGTDHSSPSPRVHVENWRQNVEPSLSAKVEYQGFAFDTNVADSTQVESGLKPLVNMTSLKNLCCDGTLVENDIEISHFNAQIQGLIAIDGKLISSDRLRSIVISLFSPGSKVYSWWFDGLASGSVHAECTTAMLVIARVRLTFGDPHRTAKAFNALQKLSPFDGSHCSSDAYWTEFVRLRKIALPPDEKHNAQRQFPDNAAIYHYISGCPPTISSTFSQEVSTARQIANLSNPGGNFQSRIEFDLDVFLVWLRGKMDLYKCDPLPT
jgi:hypothetical protein